MDKEQIIEILQGWVSGYNIEYGSYEDIADEILALLSFTEKTILNNQANQKRTYPIGDWEPIDYAGIDPVKWEGVTTNPFTKRKSCPQELKDAYKAIREVREALLKLERKLE